MVYHKYKIKGHIYAFVNEIADDGEKFCYLLLDDDGEEIRLALPKSVILYKVGEDDPDKVPEKYKKLSFQTDEFRKPTTVSGITAVSGVKAVPKGI